MTFKKKVVLTFSDKTWDIYDPRIRLDLFFRGCDLFQENVKELIMFKVQCWLKV